MKVKRKSMFTGIERELKLDINPEDLRKWENGEGLVQNVFPNLTPDEREFLITGATPEEWDEYIPDE